MPDAESGKGAMRNSPVVGQRMPHLDFLALSRNIFNYITHSKTVLLKNRLKKPSASSMETLNMLQFFKADFGIWLFIIQDP